PPAEHADIGIVEDHMATEIAPLRLDTHDQILVASNREGDVIRPSAKMNQGAPLYSCAVTAEFDGCVSRNVGGFSSSAPGYDRREALGMLDDARAFRSLDREAPAIRPGRQVAVHIAAIRGTVIAGVEFEYRCPIRRSLARVETSARQLAPSDF